MSDQTLPEFLYAVITEQRKSISTLVDALNEAKNGISQLTASAERSEESRRQVETMLEQQSTVESDLKFDLTQCRQQNEVLQGQVKTLEENLDSTEKLRFDVTCDRDLLQDTCERHAAKISAQSREITMHLQDASVIKVQLASTQEMLEKARNVVTTQNRDILKYQDEIATLKLQLAAGTLDCAVPTKTPTDTPTAANEIKAGTCIAAEGSPEDTPDRLAIICTYQPGNVIVLPDDVIVQPAADLPDLS